MDLDVDTVHLGIASTGLEGGRLCAGSSHHMLTWALLWLQQAAFGIPFLLSSSKGHNCKAPHGSLVQSMHGSFRKRTLLRSIAGVILGIVGGHGMAGY